jgi:hypothetical protein
MAALLRDGEHTSRSGVEIESAANRLRGRYQPASGAVLADRVGG